MNNNLKNYSVQPDPEIWKDIDKKLRHDRLRSQGLTGAIAASIVAAAIVGTIFWPKSAVKVADTPQPTYASAELLTPAATPDEKSATDETVALAATAQPAESPVTHTVTAEPNSPKAEAAPQILENIQKIASAPAQQPTETAPTKTAPAKVTPTAVPPAVAAPATVAEPKHTTATEPAKQENTVGNAQKSKASTFHTNIPDTIIWIPNVFAPNSGDPELEYFRAYLNRSDMVINNFRMTIFNRSGHQVFQSYDINTRWDGTYRGHAVSQGAYVYVLYYTDSEGFQHQRKGTVTLVR